jgi:hypothetical protein
LENRAGKILLDFGEELLHQAKTFGVPPKSELSLEIAEYLNIKRSLAMTYNP